MGKIQEKTCIIFLPFNTKKHRDYISFTSKYKGCFSAVGRQGGKQIINLQDNLLETGCFKLYTIVHQLFHALGFFHMQAAVDRDNYVEIDFKKVKKGQESSFDKYGSSMITNYEFGYDFLSVMHFSVKAFSLDDNFHTINTINDTYIGQRTKLTQKDIARVNNVYCNETSNKYVEWTYHKLRNIFG